MKCIIIDDEPIARLGMKRLVERHPDLEIVAMAGSSQEAAECMANHQVDLALLDIQMPGLTGIEFARQIPDSTMVIFTTAYSEYALDSYEVDALDYLVKPIDPRRFDAAIEKARQYHTLLAAAHQANSENTTVDTVDTVKTSADYLTVKADRRYVRIRFEDILYIEGLKDYVIIHTPEGKTITRLTVKGIEEQLPATHFMRVNKSYIVNIDRINSFDKNDLVIGNQEIAIGLAYRDSVINRLLQ